MKIQFLLIFFLLNSCAPNPKTAKAPQAPLIVKPITQSLVNTERFSEVATISFFLWPKSDEIPAIAHEALLERDKNREELFRDDEFDHEMGRISSFSHLNDIQKYVAEHATKLDDIYNGEIFYNYYKSKKEFESQRAELEVKISASQNITDLEKDEMRRSIVEEIVKAKYSCWALIGDPKGKCKKNLDGVGENELILYEQLIPKSCEEVKPPRWSIVQKGQCPKDISADIIEEELNKKLANFESEETLKLKKEKLKLEMDLEKLDEEKRLKLDTPVTREIDFITRGIEPNRRTIKGENLNWFEVESKKSSFYIDFSDPTKNNFKLFIKPTLRLNSDLKTFGADYMVYSNREGESEEGIDDKNSRAIQNIRYEFKSGVNKVYFRLYGKRKSDVNGRIFQVLEKNYIDAELKVYPFKHHIIYAGKIKYYSNSGVLRSGMMKIVLVEPQS